MAAARKELHENIIRLIDKTCEPCPPQNYRDQKFPLSDAHTLLHEEEQHLADNLAFLAQNKAGSETVSAVTIEERRDPHSLTVRIAANRTPSIEVVDGIKDILQVVETYARNGETLLPL